MKRHSGATQHTAKIAVREKGVPHERKHAGFVGAPFDSARHRALAAWRERVAARPAVRAVIEPMPAYVTAQIAARGVA
ncbi:MAG: hypothetical protein SF182_30375 [Deltaproteobacteria bacterium]|nr:hypothetical protein [Deltaproteobacteria bacterium]